MLVLWRAGAVAVAEMVGVGGVCNAFDWRCALNEKWAILFGLLEEDLFSVVKHF